jgi:DNA-binding PadR family transcriptional regulator
MSSRYNAIGGQARAKGNHRWPAGRGGHVIELAILGLLKEQELHGYELRKRLGELPGARAVVVSFGSLYPALSRLERAGFVKAVEAHTRTDLPVPSSGSLKGELAAFRARRALTSPAGRSKKVYGITPQGETHLLDLLTDPTPGDERAFALRVAFCRHLAPEERIALFERRRAEVLARIAERRRGTERSLDRYLRTLRERDDQTLHHDLAWLDRLIAEERTRPEGDTGELAATTEETSS